MTRFAGTPLYLAAAAAAVGNVARVRQLLDRASDPNAHDTAIGATPLHLAAGYSGSMDEVTFDREVERIRARVLPEGEKKLSVVSLATLLTRAYWDLKGDERRDFIVKLFMASLVDKGAWDAVNSIARYHVLTGKPLPPVLAFWVHAVLADQSPGVKKQVLSRPRYGSRVLVRNNVVVRLVAELVYRGCKATRSGGLAKACAEGGSACDIVARALYMGYKSVEVIWTGRVRDEEVEAAPRRAAPVHGAGPRSTPGSGT